MLQAILMALRRLPRHDRAAALRAAREWFLLPMKGVGEKRARDRIARYQLWRLQRPRPS